MSGGEVRFFSEGIRFPDHGGVPAAAGSCASPGVGGFDEVPSGARGGQSGMTGLQRVVAGELMGTAPGARAEELVREFFGLSRRGGCDA